MKFRGLDPLTRWLRWSLVAVAVGIVLGATGPAAVAALARAVVLELRGGTGVPTCFGLATSGVSVHRWVTGDHVGHHLIDPRTGRPADTDVVQATVLAASAREAEVLAKTAVILGSAAGLEFLDRFGVAGAIVLTARGERLALPQTLGWLA